MISLSILYFRFKSNHFESGLGFQLGYDSSNVSEWSYSSGECGGNFSAPNGIVTSPSYPHNYPNNANCKYTISQPIDSIIGLKFVFMDTQQSYFSATCNDYLEVRDGISESSPVLEKLCGNELPTPIQSSLNNVMLR